jgi:hypothetical protein
VEESKPLFQGHLQGYDKWLRHHVASRRDVAAFIASIA